MSVNPNIGEAARENAVPFVPQGIERLVQFQKATLDIVNQQSAEVNQKLRESFKDTVKLTEKAVSGWIEVQKSAVDVIAQSSTDIAEAAKNRSEAGSKSVTALGELVRQSVQRAAAAQKTLLDLAAEQNRAAAEAIRRQAA